MAFTHPASITTTDRTASDGLAGDSFGTSTDVSPANTRHGNGVGIANGNFIFGGPGFDTNKGKAAFGSADN